MLAVVGERDEVMSEIKFRTIACLPALKFGRSDSGGPFDGLLPETKIEEPISLKMIVEANKFIDDAGPDTKAEHERHELAGLRVFQQDEMGTVFIGDELKEPGVRRSNLVLPFW